MIQPPDSTKVIVQRVTENGAEYHILGIDTWDHFDSLITFFIKYYSVKVLKKEDAIYVRKWILQSNKNKFILRYHEDIGNYFYSLDTDKDESFMNQIAKDLTSRLSNISYE